jgi:hypothetical protein
VGQYGVVVGAAIRVATSSPKMIIVRRDEDPAVKVPGDRCEHVRPVAAWDCLFERVEPDAAQRGDHLLARSEATRSAGRAPGAPIRAQ